MKKALSERILNTELDKHLGEEEAAGSGNHRNGSPKKSMLTGTSKVTLDIPHDLLLSTGDLPIVENAPMDSYWGCGPDGNGLNKLGRILMQVRDELRRD